MFAQVFGERVALEHFGRLGDVSQSGEGLGSGGQLDGSAHLKADGFRNVTKTPLVNLANTLQQFDTLLHRGLAEGFKSRLGRRHCIVNVGLIAQRNGGAHLFRRRVKDLKVIGRCGRNPFTVDVELFVLSHGVTSVILLFDVNSVRTRGENIAKPSPLRI